MNCCAVAEFHVAMVAIVKSIALGLNPVVAALCVSSEVATPAQLAPSGPRTVNSTTSLPWSAAAVGTLAFVSVATVVSDVVPVVPIFTNHDLVLVTPVAVFDIVTVQRNTVPIWNP